MISTEKLDKAMAPRTQQHVQHIHPVNDRLRGGQKEAPPEGVLRRGNTWEW